MTKCRLCGCSYERGPKRGSDSLILCNSCFEDFKAKVEHTSEELRAIERRRMKEDESHECRECHILLEYEDVMKGDRRCDTCRKVQSDVSYLFASSSEEEFEKRLGEIVKEKERSK